MFQIDPKGEVLTRTHDMDDTKSNDNISREAVRKYIKVGSSKKKKTKNERLERRAKER